MVHCLHKHIANQQPTNQPTNQLVKTITIYLTLPDGSRSRPIHILRDGVGDPHMAPSTAKQGTPMDEATADRMIDYLTRSIDGCIAVLCDYQKHTTHQLTP